MRWRTPDFLVGTVLLGILIGSCGGGTSPAAEGAGSKLADVHLTAQVAGRDVSLYITDAVAENGSLRRTVMVDDPLDPQPVTGLSSALSPDSMKLEISERYGQPPLWTLLGVRDGQGAWQLSYQRGTSGSTQVLDLKEVNDPLVFKSVNYHSSSKVQPEDGGEVEADPVFNNESSMQVYTFSITNRSDGSRHALDSLLERTICGEAADYAALLKQEGGVSGGTGFHVDIRYRSTDRIVMGVEQTHYEEGMAHEHFGTRLLNYDLIGKREVKLSDVVPKTRMGKLKAIVKKAFYTTYPNSNRKMWPFAFTENVAFLRNGILFLYQPYEMGPFAEGYMSVHIPYSDIKDLMDANSSFAKRLAPAI